MIKLAGCLAPFYQMGTFVCIDSNNNDKFTKNLKRYRGKSDVSITLTNSVDNLFVNNSCKYCLTLTGTDVNPDHVPGSYYVQMVIPDYCKQVNQKTIHSVQMMSNQFKQFKNWNPIDFINDWMSCLSVCWSIQRYHFKYWFEK
ncbi:hypothetical protein ACTFIT_006699 [Dictyostelium discoideum]